MIIIRILVNGKYIDIQNDTTYTLKNRLFLDSDITILNGFQTAEDILLKQGDTINYIKKGVMPPLDELESMISSRHTPKLYNALKSVTVRLPYMDIVTSYLVPILARLGVGNILIPYDTTISHEEISIGDFSKEYLNCKHLETFKDIVSNINPFVNVSPLNENFDILVLPLKEESSTDKPTIYYTYGNDSNGISTENISNNRYLCGCKDSINVITSAYAMVLSGHIANSILNISLNR